MICHNVSAPLGAVVTQFVTQFVPRFSPRFFSSVCLGPLCPAACAVPCNHRGNRQRVHSGSDSPGCIGRKHPGPASLSRAARQGRHHDPQLGAGQLRPAPSETPAPERSHRLHHYSCRRLVGQSCRRQARLARASRRQRPSPHLRPQPRRTEDDPRSHPSRHADRCQRQRAIRARRFRLVSLINAYGGNFPLDADSVYTLRVAVEPRAGPAQLRAHHVAEFPPVPIVQDADARSFLWPRPLPLPMSLNCSSPRMPPSPPPSLRSGNNPSPAVEKPAGDYFVAYALDYSGLAMPLAGAKLHPKNLSS